MNSQKQSLFSSQHPWMSEFWSEDLGLTLMMLSLIILIFVITPFREAGLPGRLFFDLLMLTLMIYGTLSVRQSRIKTAFVIITVFICATILGIARIHPTLFLHELGSLLSTITLLLHVRIVLLVMFRSGPINVEPHSRWRFRLSSSWNGLGVSLSVARTASAWFLPFRYNPDEAWTNLRRN